MTDQTIPAELPKEDVALARDWASHILKNPGSSIPMEQTAAQVLQALLPPPPLPTLADIPHEDRAAYRRAQADVKGRDRRPVIVNPYWEDGTARIMWPNGFIEEIEWERITPRPDLRRLEWPGDTPAPAPAHALPDGWRLADHPEHGRVLVVRTDGENAIYATRYKATGIRTRICMTSDLEFADPAPVPPSTLDVGSEWDDNDALARACRESGRDQITVTDRDGDVHVWGAVAGWWEDASPAVGYEPFTILHAGKKAVQ